MKRIRIPALILLVFSCCLWYYSTEIQAKNTTKKEIIYLVPTGNFPMNQVQFLRQEIEQFYSVSVVILPGITIPKSAYIPSLNRYQANKILQFLTEKYRTKNAKVLALTNRDICTDRELNGVLHRNYRIFGLGYMPGNACVVSSSRFKSDVPRKLALVTLHELGHNYGLPHCNSNATCMMNDAKGTGKALEHEKKWFCPSCKKLFLQKK